MHEYLWQTHTEIMTTVQLPLMFKLVSTEKKNYLSFSLDFFVLSIWEKLLHFIKYRFSINKHMQWETKRFLLFKTWAQRDVKRILAFLKGEIQSAEVDRFSAATYDHPGWVLWEGWWIISRHPESSAQLSSAITCKNVHLNILLNSPGPGLVKCFAFIVYRWLSSWMSSSVC